MNAMGHGLNTFIGLPKRELARSVKRIVPGYMAMGTAGMAEMGAMEMPMPENTLPMMTGFGQFGPMEMGGMFSVVKVRDAIAAGDYRDPGPYAHPPGTVAYEVVREAAEAPRLQDHAPAGKSSSHGPAAPALELKVVKPGAMSGHDASH